MKLEMWVIYDHPLDFPDKFVARCWLLDQPTDAYYFADDVEELRDRFEGMGLYRMPPFEEDDPCIIEVWF